RYNLGKKWGEDMLRNARSQYHAAEPFLSTSGAPTTNSDEAVARALRILLLARGVPEKTLAGLDLTGKDDEQLKEIVRKLGAAPVEKPVSVEEAQRLMAEGWTYGGPFGASMVLLRAPLVAPDASTPGPEIAASGAPVRGGGSGYH
ncbi:MAG: hypothetical protein L3K08_08990, partial [Thermoplasmata archaeon]|nr:hypothetical protein [Thermoplasmata archaeon]